MTDSSFCAINPCYSFNEHGKILLFKNASTSSTNKIKWKLPGGKIDPEESFDEALKREIFEETGLFITLTHATETAEQIMKCLYVIHLVMTVKLSAVRFG